MDTNNITTKIEVLPRRSSVVEKVVLDYICVATTTEPYIDHETGYIMNFITITTTTLDGYIPNLSVRNLISLFGKGDFESVEYEARV